MDSLKWQASPRLCAVHTEYPTLHSFLLGADTPANISELCWRSSLGLFCFILHILHINCQSTDCLLTLHSYCSVTFYKQEHILAEDSGSDLTWLFYQTFKSMILSSCWIESWEKWLLICKYYLFGLKLMLFIPLYHCLKVNWLIKHLIFFKASMEHSNFPMSFSEIEKAVKTLENRKPRALQASLVMTKAGCISYSWKMWCWELYLGMRTKLQWRVFLVK